MNTKEIEKRIIKGLKKEDRKDVEFRALITLSQLTELSKYITHDQALNPDARPFGSRGDEELAYGQAFTQLAILCHLRGITLTDAFEIGLSHWEKQDWRKSKPKNKKTSTRLIRRLEGSTAKEGIHKGRAILIDRTSDILKVDSGDIIILSSHFPEITSVMEKIGAIVTDHGSFLSHIAIISREFNVPCVVGTGNATELIKEGTIVTVDATKGEVLF